MAHRRFFEDLRFEVTQEVRIMLTRANREAAKASEVLSSLFQKRTSNSSTTTSEMCSNALMPAPISPLSPVRPTLQCKLKVNQPGDKYEQEADRIADQVMRMTDSRSSQLTQNLARGGQIENLSVARSDSSQLIKRKGTAQGAPGVPSLVQDVISSPGKPLDSDSRSYFEPRLGRDLSQVRVHTDPAAAVSAQAINAQAYTVGSHIAFAAGEHQPNSFGSRRLLAHELTHVLQQKSGQVEPSIQRYEGPEHMRLGSAGWKDRIPLKNYPQGLKYDEIVALAGDIFGSFDELEKAKPEEIDRVLLVVRQQRDRYDRTRKSALNGGSSESDAIHAAHNKAYGTEMNLALDRASSGRYLDLAQGKENLSHFSTVESGTNPALNNWQRYSHEHGLAIQAALAGKKDEARARDGFAAHYLTDRFSAGHIRADVNANAPERKRQHDRDNEHGLNVENERGDQWIMFGDGYLDHPQNMRNIELAEEAVRLSQQEIESATQGTPPGKEYAAIRLIPRKRTLNAGMPPATTVEEAKKLGLGTISFLSDLPLIGMAIRGGIRLWDYVNEDDRARETADAGTSDLPVSQRVILIQQMLSGATLDADEGAIIKIFEQSTAGDQEAISRQVSLENIYSAVDGDELRTLINVLRPMYRNWNVDQKQSQLSKRLTGSTRDWEEVVCLTVLEEANPEELRVLVNRIGRARILDELSGHNGRINQILAKLDSNPAEKSDAEQTTVSPRITPSTQQVQPKLTVNQPGDKYEQEADQVADQVMRMSTAAGPIRAVFAGRTAPASVMRQSMLGQIEPGNQAVDPVMRSPGQPLDVRTRQFFEPRFGRDLSQVRVHSDAASTASANALQARAYTIGSTIVFGQNQFNASTQSGRKLIAHELTHVLQQSPSNLIRRCEKESDSKHTPAGIIDAHTTLMNLDEAGLGRTLLDRAVAGEYLLVLAVFDELGSSDRDDVAYEMVLAATDAQLDQFGSGAPGQSLLLRLQNELTEGQAAEEEKDQSLRIVQSQSRRIGKGKFDAQAQQAKIFPYRAPGLTVFDDAPIQTELRDKQRVHVKIPVRVLGTDKFKTETKTLPIETFTTGIDLDRDEIIGVKFYDQGGVTLYRPASFLLEVGNQSTADTLRTAGDAAMLGATLPFAVAGSGGRVAAGGARALLWADRVAVGVGIVSTITREHRGWILENYGDDGATLLRFVDMANSAAQLYGGARAVIGMTQISTGLVRSLRGIKNAKRPPAMTSERHGAVDQMSAQADEIELAVLEANASGAASRPGAKSSSSSSAAEIPHAYSPTTSSSRQSRSVAERTAPSSAANRASSTKNTPEHAGEKRAADRGDPPRRVKQDVYVVGKDGKDIGQLDVWEVDASGRRVFIEQKDGTGIGKLNPVTKKPFRDPAKATVEFGQEQILKAGRKKATALKDGIATRGDNGADVPSIEEIKKATHIRFEIKADTPEIRIEVETRLLQLRGEFPEFTFEARFGE